MTKPQAIVTALMGALLIHFGIDGEGYICQAALVYAGVCLCAAFTI
jgi:hypothetical protein